MTTSVRLALMLTATWLIDGANLPAQGSGAGVVYDSLRARAPLARAEVAILGTSTRTTTDSLGRFTFAVVPREEFVVVAWVPWLDSVAIPFLHQKVVGGVGARSIKLATPSLATFQRSVCGAALAEDQAILLGELRDSRGAPVAAQFVWAGWSDHIVEGKSVRREFVAAADTTNADGLYALCGVPLHRRVTLRATGDTIGSGELEVEITSAIQRRDIFVGPGTAQRVVAGRVVRLSAEASGRSTPISGAEIHVLGDSVNKFRSDSAGSFRLRLPWRSIEIVVRSPGHTPAQLAVPLTTSDDSVWTIVLDPLAQQLAEVEVIGDAFRRERAEFEERRAMGLGRFITEDMLEKLPIVTPNVLRGILPNIAIQGRSSYPRVMIRGSTTFGYCDPRIFENGIDRGKMEEVDERVDLARLIQIAKRLEVYSAAMAPPKFNDNDGCGSIVIWTR